MMRFFNNFFRFYINSSIHVALAVVSLTVLTYFQFQLAIDYKLLIFIFLSSITGYNFVKYAPIAKLHHRSLTQQLKQIQIFSFIVFLGLVVCVFFISLKIILTCAVLGLITLFYAIPLGRKNLREIAFLKIFVIAFIWTFSTFVLPFIDNSFEWTDLNKVIGFQFFERLLWVVLLMIPFEIRDLRFDKKHLKTLVTTFGVWPTKIGSLILLILLFFQKLYALNTDLIWIYVCIYISLAAAIIFAKPVQRPYYSSFYVEALPILWLLLVGIKMGLTQIQSSL